MVRFWLFAPYFSYPQKKYSFIFDQVWGYDLQNNVTALGWNELGDYSKLSVPELRATFIRTYQDRSPGNTTSTVNILWAFYHEISVDDVIIARKGRKRIVGVGVVTGKAFYNKEKGIDRVDNPNAYYYPNFLPVSWKPKSIVFDEIVFGMRTLYELDEQKYRSLVERPAGQEK